MYLRYMYICICIYVYYISKFLNKYILFIGPETSVQDYKHHVPVTCLRFSLVTTRMFYKG